MSSNVQERYDQRMANRAKAVKRRRKKIEAISKEAELINRIRVENRKNAIFTYASRLNKMSALYGAKGARYLPKQLKIHIPGSKSIKYQGERRA